MRIKNHNADETGDQDGAKYSYIKKVSPTEYILDFGKVFQGRSGGVTSASKIIEFVNDLNENHVFQAEIDDSTYLDSNNTTPNVGRHRITLNNVDGIVSANKGTIKGTGELSVQLYTTYWGGSSIEDAPEIKVVFPDLKERGKVNGAAINSEITIKAVWYNYRVKADPIDPKIVLESVGGSFGVMETESHQAFLVQAEITDDIDSIPPEENINMEILLDSPDQVPTPMDATDSNGFIIDAKLDDEGKVVKEGRVGVMVKFYSKTSPLGLGDKSSITKVWVRKESIVAKKDDEDLAAIKKIAAVFGEHSSDGVFSSCDDRWKVSEIASPLQFKVVGEIKTPITDADSKVDVTWYIDKVVPTRQSTEDPSIQVEGIDGDVSVLFRIPTNDYISGVVDMSLPEYDRMFERSKPVIIPKGEFHQDVTTVSYTRKLHGQGIRELTPIGVVWNTKAVTWDTADTITLPEMPADVLLPIAPPFITVDKTLTGHNKDIKVALNISDIQEWIKDGRVINAEFVQHEVAVDASGIEYVRRISSIGTYSITSKGTVAYHVVGIHKINNVLSTKVTYLKISPKEDYGELYNFSTRYAKVYTGYSSVQERNPKYIIEEKLEWVIGELPAEVNPNFSIKKVEKVNPVEITYIKHGSYYTADWYVNGTINSTIRKFEEWKMHLGALVAKPMMATSDKGECKVTLSPSGVVEMIGAVQGTKFSNVKMREDYIEITDTHFWNNISLATREGVMYFKGFIGHVTNRGGEGKVLTTTYRENIKENTKIWGYTNADFDIMVVGRRITVYKSSSVTVFNDWTKMTELITR